MRTQCPQHKAPSVCFQWFRVAAVSLLSGRLISRTPSLFTFTIDRVKIEKQTEKNTHHKYGSKKATKATSEMELAQGVRRASIIDCWQTERAEKLHHRLVCWAIEQDSYICMRVSAGRIMAHIRNDSVAQSSHTKIPIGRSKVTTNG